MNNRKRPLMENQESDFYQTPSDYSDEEMQRSCEFVKKVQQLDDETVFVKFVNAMKSYQSKSLTYMDLKNKVISILRNHDVLVQEFHQLISDSTTDEKNPIAVKSDVERTVEFLNKLEGLGKGLHGAFLNELVCGGDIVDLVGKLDVILQDRQCLKEEFKAFLVDSRLLKNPKRGSEEAEAEELGYVTPSYTISLDAEHESSSSNEILNEKYVSTGHYDVDKVKKRRHSSREVRMNNLEDKLLKEDRYLEALNLVVKFGNELSEKPPVGFNEVVKQFYEDRGKNVPQEFKTDPKRAVQGILPILKSMKKKMTDAKKFKVEKIYNLFLEKEKKNLQPSSEQVKKFLSLLLVFLFKSVAAL